jgi:hypothetical protein
LILKKNINRDDCPYDINMMVMPGTLEDKHKDVDPEKGIQALRRQFNLIYILPTVFMMYTLAPNTAG